MNDGVEEPDFTQPNSDSVRMRFRPHEIERSPSNLVKEARKAFDAELFIACITLLVTIPDVCAHLLDLKDKNGQRSWCVKYLKLPAGPVCEDINRSRRQSRSKIDQTLSELEREDNFTASDFSQLRNAILHAGSSVVDGSGAKYSPFHSIGIRIDDCDNQLIGSFGVRSSPTSREIEANFQDCEDEIESDCELEIVISLLGLLTRMEKGVELFLDDYPKLNRENGKLEHFTWGIVDIRSR